jgi:hypothetical protein
MADRTLTSLGGTCAILAGALLPVSAIAFLLMPAPQQTWADPAAYLESFAHAPTYALVEYSANAAAAVLALCAVLAVPRVLRPTHEGWLRWATVIGLLGYSLIALQYLREIALIPPMAERYLMADVPTRTATAPNLYLVLLDPQGWISYGATGGWLLAISLLGLLGHRWPRTLSILGVAGGLAYWLIVAGTAFNVDSLVTIAVAAGVILAPATLIWIGIFLRRWMPDPPAAAAG